MKKFTFAIAALAALCTCNKAEMQSLDFQDAAESVLITVNSAVGGDSKVTIGQKVEGVYPVSWNESGERIFVREVARDADPTKVTTADTGSVSFSRIDAHNAQFAIQMVAQTKEVIYDYASVYPCNPDGIAKDLPNGVRRSGTDAKNRVSYALNYDTKQVPQVNAPDPATHIMVAFDMNHSAQASSLNFAFKYVVGFGKMTIKNFPALASGETVSKIKISAPSGKNMSGRMFHYYHENTDGTHKAGDVIPYSATTVKNYVLIDPANITFNTSGFDVWFTTFAFDLAAKDALSIEVTTSAKTYTANLELSKALKFECGKVSEFVYDWEKGQPKKETKTLVFDFSSSTPLEGWPSADKWDTKAGNKYCKYTLDKLEYQFFLTDVAEATNARVFWATDGRGIVLGAVHRFLGFPVLTGYKLISASFVQGTADSASGRQAGITSKVTQTTSEAYTYVKGGEAISWTKKGDTYTYSLTGTTKDTMYYLTCAKGGVGATSVTLIYEKVD